MHQEPKDQAMITVSLYCYDGRLHKLTDTVFVGPWLSAIDVPAVPQVGDIIVLSRFLFRVTAVTWSLNLNVESIPQQVYQFDQIRVTCDWVETR